MRQQLDGVEMPVKRRRRCLACGARFEADLDPPEPWRCRECAWADKPVDRLMRWIWQDLDEQSAR